MRQTQTIVQPLLYLDLATLNHTEQGTPYASAYNDVYHAAAGALAQAQQVFLAGNELPLRWQGRDQFVVVETGFGLGHNFLATLDAWQRDVNACARLHFVSVEKHPFLAADLARAHADAGTAADHSEALLAQWPLPLPGVHRLSFCKGRVTLTLLFGTAESLLPSCQAQWDAIFLDGFSPSKNPEMWSEGVFKTLARKARPDCTLASWCVAGAVRTGLSAAGFDVEKAPGFAHKRHMLRACINPRRSFTLLPAPTERTALVVGAGLAGSAIAERLAERGWQISLLESASGPAQGASGNLAGAFRPHPAADDSYLARLTRAGYLYALQRLKALSAAGQPVRWQACGVLHVARNATQEAKLRHTQEVLRTPHTYLQFVDAARASEIAGYPLAFGAWWFAQAGWINPPSLCQAQLAAAGDACKLDYGQTVARIRQHAGQWQALNDAGEVLTSAAHIVLANAFDAKRLANAQHIPLSHARGQVSHLPANEVQGLKTVVCGAGYITPSIDGIVPTGASFEVEDECMDLRESEHAENLDKLERMLPGYAAGVSCAADHLDGRVGQRPITPDRLPMVGRIDEREGLWMLSGFGARGLVWGQLCAELLASQLNAEPWPLERELAEAMNPQRYQKKTG